MSFRLAPPSAASSLRLDQPGRRAGRSRSRGCAGPPRACRPPSPPRRGRRRRLCLQALTLPGCRLRRPVAGEETGPPRADRRRARTRGRRFRSAQPDALARHYEESGDLEKAATMWERAGRLALDRAELAEAEPQLQRALTLIDSFPVSPSAGKLRQAVKAQLATLRGFYARRQGGADLIQRPSGRKESPFLARSGMNAGTIAVVCNGTLGATPRVWPWRRRNCCTGRR